MKKMKKIKKYLCNTIPCIMHNFVFIFIFIFIYLAMALPMLAIIADLRFSHPHSMLFTGFTLGMLGGLVLCGVFPFALFLGHLISDIITSQKK